MENQEPKIPKKRGRKPKGGKIIEKKKDEKINKDNTSSIILHLKCFKKDIINQYEPQICNVEPYCEDKIEYEIIENTNMNIKEDDDKYHEKQKKNIYDKLSELEKKLHHNCNDKKSNCFWCTCSFDTPTIFIPKNIKTNTYDVYGYFCSPECASSYLFNENITDSVKYERFQLLNYVYGKIYNYNESIKLAPCPYYTLDKFLGDLSIQEYRNLLTYDRLLLFTDKPLTKIYPELHEDNNNFEPLYNNKMMMRKNNQIDKKKHIKDAFQV